MFYLTRSAAAALLACTFALNLQANGPNSLHLEETTVIANRKPDVQAALAASVQLITREEIDSAQAAELADLLAGHAGIHIARNGAPGQNASIFMRGTDSDHTLVLINGQRINSLADGRARLEYIALEQIERIEILRGGRSSLYGSEAIGGVVNIVTRESVEGNSLRLQAGSFNERGVGGNLATRQGPTDISLNLRYKEVGGYDARAGLNPDKDGHRNFDAGIALSHQLTDNTQLRLETLYNEGYTEFDDGFWMGGTDGSDDYRRRQHQLSGSHSWNHNWSGNFSVARLQERAYSDGPFGPFVSNTDRDLYRVEAQFAATTGWTASTLAEFQQDAYASNYLPVGLDRNNRALAAVWDRGSAQRPLSVSLRNDWNERYGSHTTGNLSAGMKAMGGLLWASAGNAFKAPNFFDLYGFGGDPNLEPERATNLELGWKGTLETAQLTASVFQIRTRDLIEYNNLLAQIFNVGDARVRGAELAMAGELAAVGGAGYRLQITHLLHRNLDTDQPLLRRPRNQLRLDLSQPLLGVDWLLTGLISGPARDIGNQSIGGYAVVDVAASKALATNIDLRAKIGNLGDRSYQTVSGFPQPRRHFNVALDYRF